MQALKIGVVMDPITSITPYKDSTLAMLLVAQSRGHSIIYFTINDLSIDSGVARATGRPLRVFDDNNHWHELGQPSEWELADLDVLLMRKDPPFNMEYIYATYALDLAEQSGVLVVNSPASLRNINEKAFTAHFPQCCPDTLVTRSKAELLAFRKRLGRVVLKPLDGMGGAGVFVVRPDDNNANVIIETLTENESRFIIAQAYIPEISDGDKRLILVDGQAPQYALARIPPADDNRGNLAMGATGEVRELSDRDRWICEQVGPELSQRGVLFAGLDVIGDYLTEINVTSPTGIREIAAATELNLADELFDCIETKFNQRLTAA